MTAPPSKPGDTGWDFSAGFTQDPDLTESDRTLGRTPIYYEEAGVRAGQRALSELKPCTICGVQVITGRTDRGDLVHVEPETVTYALLWMSNEARPRLTLGRGYPAHRCQGPREQASVDRR